MDRVEKTTKLRCPRCRAVLGDEGDLLVCAEQACGYRYPIVDGIPVLIDERASIFRIADYTAQALTKPPQSSLHSFALRALPSLDLNVSSRRNAALLREGLFERAERPEMLNIGGKHSRAALADLGRDTRIDCTECDSVPGPGVTVITDARALPFADSSFDVVVLDGVLEHSVDPQGIADEVHRVLRPGGLVYADTPFMLPVHGGAYDFGRFSSLAHRRLFACFSQISAGVSSGPAAALGYSIQSVLLTLARGRKSRFALKTLTRLVFFWIKYLDLWISSRPGAIDAALGVYFVGERAETPISDRELLEAYAGNTPDLYAHAEKTVPAASPSLRTGQYLAIDGSERR